MLKVPIGGIIMWSGDPATVPANYHLCDGADGTPNLMNWMQYLIVGAGDHYNVGDTGGEWYRNASHVHHSDFDLGLESSHFHRFLNNFRTGGGDTCVASRVGMYVPGLNCTHTHEMSITTDPGSPHTHGFTDGDTSPGYLEADCNYPDNWGLYFIMRMS
jgi:hypothetical protein